MRTPRIVFVLTFALTFALTFVLNLVSALPAQAHFIDDAATYLSEGAQHSTLFQQWMGRYDSLPRKIKRGMDRDEVAELFKAMVTFYSVFAQWSPQPGGLNADATRAK